MDVIMPKMGESVSEGTIIKWHKKKGDSVKRDEIIFEISTDKVDTEIPSPAEGVLSEIKVQEGDTVDVGTVVAIIEENGNGSGPSEASSEKSETKSEEKSAVEEKKSEKNSQEKSSKKEEEKASQEKSSKKEEEKSEQKVEEKPAVEVKSSSGGIIEIAMPKMGESVMEGTIIKWHKKVGEPIKKDETIFEISTDKVDTEVPSPEAGTLSEILVGEQETVEVGTVVAKLSTGESKTESKEAEKKSDKKEEKIEEKKETPEAMHDNFAVSSAREEGVEESKEELGFLSPLVLNIAKKENVSFDELKKIKGTGLDERITKKDILQYIQNRGAKKEAPAKEARTESKKETGGESSQMKPVYSSEGTEEIPMDNIRQKIMNHMINSRDTSVHVSAMLEVDMSKIYNFIQKKKDEYQQREGIKLTYMPFIANAVVKGLKEFPLMNSSIDGNKIIQKKYVNLGIAVAIEPAGLIVPNIKGAGERNIIGLAKSINDLAFRARNKKLTPDDITNGTFTITNYGVFGTIFGTPIINQPEVAILGVGTVIKKPVVIEADGTDTIAIKPIMALTLSHDHRLVDGMLGGKFLKFVKETLESFDESNI
jgi:2-oxoglutarate dehydrogenase dihydrolipoamide succinyltransferase (E2 component)